MVDTKRLHGKVVNMTVTSTPYSTLFIGISFAGLTTKVRPLMSKCWMS